MKRFFLFLALLVVLTLVCSCDEILVRTIVTGPAGGYVFYDCDADNESGNADGLISTECGWRYLEVAPEDITEDETTKFIFGYYRTAPNSQANIFVNGYTYVAGTSSATDGKSTGTAVGTGQANTTKLVSKMGSNAYSGQSGSATTDVYAAKLCDNYTYGGYDDWFLPSRDELKLMNKYLRLRRFGLMGKTYWSSSEYEGSSEGNVISVWCHCFGGNGIGESPRVIRYGTCEVRAIRAFM